MPASEVIPSASKRCEPSARARVQRRLPSSVFLRKVFPDPGTRRRNHTVTERDHIEERVDQIMVEEFEVDPGVLAGDVLRLVGELQQNGLVRAA